MNFLICSFGNLELGQCVSEIKIWYHTKALIYLNNYQTYIP
jgi:hypothetical protein